MRVGGAGMISWTSLEMERRPHARMQVLRTDLQMESEHDPPPEYPTLNWIDVGQTPLQSAPPSRIGFTQHGQAEEGLSTTTDTRVWVGEFMGPRVMFEVVLRPPALS